jgi:hypothetical protein
MWLPGGFLKPSQAGQCDGRPRDDGKSRVFLDASPAPRSNTRPLRRIPPSRAFPAPISIGPAHGQVAQLVEQRTENPRVDGSIPSLATISSVHLAVQRAMFHIENIDALFSK